MEQAECKDLPQQAHPIFCYPRKYKESSVVVGVGGHHAFGQVIAMRLVEL
jgi:hypothetical protein